MNHEAGENGEPGQRALQPDRAERRHRYQQREAAALDGADTRVRQNLALVLGVQGKFDEAEQAAGSDTPRALVEANNSYFRALLTPARNYDRLRGTSD